MSFAKDGNSDIYTMDLDTRLLKESPSPSIDTSRLFHQTVNLLRLILTEVVYNKFM